MLPLAVFSVASASLHALLENGLVVDGLFFAADAVGNIVGRFSPAKESKTGKTGGACHNKQNDDIADNRIVKRAPIAEGNERPCEIDDRSQRAKPDAVQNRACNLLPKHLVSAIQPASSFRLFTSLYENLDPPVFGASFRSRIVGDRRVRSLAFDFDPR